MSCNCKTSKNILNLHKKYGYETNVSWFSKRKFNIKIKMLHITYLLLLIIFFPMVLLWAIVFIIRNKNIININKLFKKFIR